MKAHEPECVAMKKRGAKYVSQLLTGKSREEELEFWIQRTEKLLDRKRNRTISTHNTANAADAKSRKTD